MRMLKKAGSFLEAVPGGGDAYILKHILHDWPNESCVQILKNIRSVMLPNGVLIIVEFVVPDKGNLLSAETNESRPSKQLT